MTYIKHPKHIPFEYSRITEYIYLGTNQCCIKHNFAKNLVKKRIEADISLEYENIDAPFGAIYFLWLPVKDHTAPTTKQILIGANALKNLVENKIKVYVHCRRAHGRSPTLVAAYFILEGKTAKEAIRIMREKRPSIHLRESQIKSLIKFEEVVRNGRKKRNLWEKLLPM